VDVVPTLVHALAREPLTPRGVHGRSLLGPLWADQVLLTAPSRPQRGVFVRGDRRLGLRLALDGPRIFSPGFVDARDDLDDAPLPPAADAATWAAALGEELERLAR
jgi:hypothetical protein